MIKTVLKLFYAIHLLFSYFSDSLWKRVHRYHRWGKMVDLGGYVIILVETHDKKVKLYGKFQGLPTNILHIVNFLGFTMAQLLCA